MTEERRPAPAESKPGSNEEPSGGPDDDFFGSNEHDGWGPIEKRRPTEPPKTP